MGLLTVSEILPDSVQMDTEMNEVLIYEEGDWMGRVCRVQWDLSTKFWTEMWIKATQETGSCQKRVTGCEL
jgi:hypothetical protein